MVQSAVSVHSEVGQLQSVMLHRPGAELENLMPEYLSRQLFDDIPYLPHAREEHDQFAATLRARGVTVLYLLDLVAEAVEAEDVRASLADDFIREAGLTARGAADELRAYLLALPPRGMLDAMVSGVRKSQLASKPKRHLIDYIDNSYPFLVDPMPNTYFTRDAFFMVGGGVCVSRMANDVRHRETLFGEYLFRFHPLYKDVPRLYQRTAAYPIEGGDMLVLSKKAVAIGISQRTDPRAVEDLAAALLSEETGFERVLAIDIPKIRAYMHLDTVLTMVDRDKFTVHPSILPNARGYSLTRDGNRLRIRQQERSLRHVLEETLETEAVTFIHCGGSSVIDAAREQWNDGTNTLAVAPGEVIAFSRNYVTNASLREHGVIVHEIPSAELSRGRGGPRCMSMPFVRKPL